MNLRKRIVPTQLCDTHSLPLWLHKTEKFKDFSISMPIIQLYDMTYSNQYLLLQPAAGCRPSIMEQLSIVENLKATLGTQKLVQSQASCRRTYEKRGKGEMKQKMVFNRFQTWLQQKIVALICIRQGTIFNFAGDPCHSPIVMSYENGPKLRRKEFLTEKTCFVCSYTSIHLSMKELQYRYNTLATNVSSLIFDVIDIGLF